MKIAVLGSKGMLGYGMITYFNKFPTCESVAISRDKFDVLIDDIIKLIPLINDCDAVVNCIGIIKPMIEHYNLEEILSINCLFPRNLAKLCDSCNIPCFHITTDCAYNGERGGYTESDILDANDIYGLSKIAGETTECMTIRTSIVGEELGEGRSLFAWVMNQKDGNVNGFTNHMWNGVTTTHLANLIRCILSYNHYRNGIYHLFTKKSVSKYELLCIFNDVYDLNINITPVEADIVCDRTLASNFGLVESLIKYDLPRQIQDMKKLFEG